MSTKINAKVARRLGVRRFDAAEYLRDEADIAAYLEAAAAEEDPRVLAAALGDVAGSWHVRACAADWAYT